MKKRTTIFYSFLALAIIIVLFFYSQKTAYMCRYPYCYANAAVITVDDVSMANEYQLNLTRDIAYYIASKNLSATFFVIPTEAKKIDFSENIEVAQHGYSHRNSAGLPYEFLGISDAEKEERVKRGKALLEGLGFQVYGFRAPGYFLEKKDLRMLQKYFYYDSSFFLDRKDGTFEIPVILSDLTFFVCDDQKCSSSLMLSGKAQEEWVIALSNLLERPIVLSLHFWPLGSIFSHNEGSKYMDDVAGRIIGHDYWATTLKDYHFWRELSGKTVYHYDRKNSFLKIENPVKGEGFVINSKKSVASNAKLECHVKGKSQLCIIK